MHKIVIINKVSTKKLDSISKITKKVLKKQSEMKTENYFIRKKVKKESIEQIDVEMSEEDKQRITEYRINWNKKYFGEDKQSLRKYKKSSLCFQKSISYKKQFFCFHSKKPIDWTM